MGVVFLAWRCLYAEVVDARIHNRKLQLHKTLLRTMRMLISRLLANGHKWHKWYSTTRYHRPTRVKKFPKRYQKRILAPACARPASDVRVERVPRNLNATPLRATALFMVFVLRLCAALSTQSYSDDSRSSRSPFRPKSSRRAKVPFTF